MRFRIYGRYTSPPYRILSQSFRFEPNLSIGQSRSNGQAGSVLSKMSRRLNALLIAIAIALLAHPSWSVPECGRSVEDCKERRMHPDLPEPERNGRAYRVVEGEDTTAYWRQQGIQFVQQKLASQLNQRQAKNVILFLGDGMGVTTTSAARNLLGGEEKTLSFENFPYTGLSKTYSVDKIVPDSACTATAYLCGVKGQEGTIGVNGQVPRTDCKVMLDERVTHASPSGVYAHIAERDWENDAEVGLWNAFVTGKLVACKGNY